MNDFSLIEQRPQPTAVVRTIIPVAEIPRFLGHAYEAIMRALAEEGIEPAGPPFAYYLGVPTDTVELEAGFPVAAPCTPYGEVIAGELPGGTIAMGMHVGPYETMVQTYDEMGKWIADKGLVPQNGMWEIYLTDPQQEPDASKWQTQIFWPVAAASIAV
jgi:effector-binding domain-containing protein